MKKEYGVLTFRLAATGERREIFVKGPRIDGALYGQIVVFAAHAIGEKDEFPSDFRETMEHFLRDNYEVLEPRYYDTIKVW
jgi:hypothetical protein